MPTGEEHRLARAVHKAQRNARARDRRRRGDTPAVSWERAPDGYRRCTGCGRWCSEEQTAGHGYGFRWCESCLVARELRLEARRLAEADERDAGRAAA